MMKPKIFNGRGRIITDILGRSKYSNYSQALNEAVANALDAHSNNIQINLNNKFIEVIDDGEGMDKDKLLNKYFTLGEENIDPESRGQFGIGVCANAALGNILTVNSRKKGGKNGYKVKVNFNEVEKCNIGDYEPDEFEKIEFDDKKYSTMIGIEQLRWDNINEVDFIEYIKEKHFPLLLDKDFNINIYINGDKLDVSEPKYSEKYEFDSSKKFILSEKFVPIIEELSCGKIQGTFYLNDETWEEPSIDIYVKNQRIDGYSGDNIDWLRIKDLSSAEGFRRRIKGIIKVEAISEKDIDKTKPIKGLILKSDRTAFFENRAYRQLCAYLNGTIRNKEIKLPHGGILRIINDNWYRNRGVDINKTKALIDHVKDEIMPELKEILKGEKMHPEINNLGEKEKDIRKESTSEINKKSENLMFKCPSCSNILRIKKEVLNKWKGASGKDKDIIKKDNWTCNACGYVLDPNNDKYKRGPIKGTRIAKVELEEGVITDILVDALGKEGPRAIYNPDEGVIKINAQHSLLIYALKTSDESFKCNVLDSILYSIAIRRSEEKRLEFQKIYNDLCGRVSKVIDMREFEKALDKFRL